MFNLNLSNVPEEKRVSWTKHRVQSGDSLNKIAVRYHTTPNLLKQVNQLSSNSVRPNQSILIPSTKNTSVIEKTEETNPIHPPLPSLKGPDKETLKVCLHNFRSNCLTLLCNLL